MGKSSCVPSYSSNGWERQTQAHCLASPGESWNYSPFKWNRMPLARMEDWLGEDLGTPNRGASFQALPCYLREWPPMQVIDVGAPAAAGLTGLDGLSHRRLWPYVCSALSFPEPLEKGSTASELWNWGVLRDEAPNWPEALGQVSASSSYWGVSARPGPHTAGNVPEEGPRPGDEERSQGLRGHGYGPEVAPGGQYRHQGRQATARCLSGAS